MNYSFGNYSIKDKKIIKGEEGTFKVKSIGITLMLGYIASLFLSLLIDDLIIRCYFQIFISSIIIIISIIALLLKLKKDNQLELFFVFISMIMTLMIVFALQDLDTFRRLLQ